MKIMGFSCNCSLKSINWQMAPTYVLLGQISWYIYIYYIYIYIYTWWYQILEINTIILEINTNIMVYVISDPWFGRFATAHIWLQAKSPKTSWNRPNLGGFLNFEPHKNCFFWCDRDAPQPQGCCANPSVQWRNWPCPTCPSLEEHGWLTSMAGPWVKYNDRSLVYWWILGKSSPNIWPNYSG